MELPSTALIMDTETTGLIDNHTLKIEKQPEVIEYYAALVDLVDGKTLKEYHHFIKPHYGLPEEIIKITGIKEDDLKTALAFSEVSGEIRSTIESAPMVIAHNASFDQEMIDIEFERMGQVVKWPRLICTVEQTVHLNGRRMNLTDLHDELIGGKFADAHRADADVGALSACAIKMRDLGLL